MWWDFCRSWVLIWAFVGVAAPLQLVYAQDANTPVAEAAPTLAPNDAEALMLLGEQVQKLQKSPIFGLLLKLAGNADFRQAATKIAERGRWRDLVIYQLVVIVFVFLLRNYEYSRLEKGAFIPRLWISVWTSGFLFGMASLVVPLAHFGVPYWTLIRVLWTTVTAA